MRLMPCILLFIIVISFGTACTGIMHKELPDSPIKPTISVGDSRISYHMGAYCWTGTNSNSGICSDPPHTETFNKIIEGDASEARPKQILNINFPIIPDNYTLYLENKDGTREQVQYNILKGRYSLPKENGYYLYVLSAKWGENDVTYYFGVNVR
ncbi:hypothetical protein [Paenibacillus sediminis]|uniref:Lipoprotein n=1 Tax=Paenibacillus sediminis TaxID=664909 RepID=A0ABS4H1W8_9BACL|nr:hypothetical protein [Paenibacillus sediminis]MBP1936527.1 hypothetical protein [Paenibacillus sediminis]